MEEFCRGTVPSKGFPSPNGKLGIAQIANCIEGSICSKARGSFPGLFQDHHKTLIISPAVCSKNFNLEKLKTEDDEEDPNGTNLS